MHPVALSKAERDPSTLIWPRICASERHGGDGEGASGRVETSVEIVLGGGAEGCQAASAPGGALGTGRV